MSANSRKTHTVKEVAKLSGVSVRTLRFYDEIGLLKPAYYGENGYRYYGKEQLLCLQQILFYRELGFELAMIQKIIADPGFDKITALRSHRQYLEKETDRTRALIRTIDKTLAHLEMEAPMADDEMYMGFDPEKQLEYETHLHEKFGANGEKNITESKRRTQKWKREDYERVMQDYDRLHKAFTDSLRQGLAVESTEVQNLVQQHYAVVDRFWTPTRTAYIGLGRGYCEHPDFKKLYESYHPNLAEYLAGAMRIFAESQLTG